jgi:LEA14-like dessication related protein
MDISRNSKIYGIILLIIILIAFLGYTYYADADAIQHVIVEVDTINNISPKITSATLTFTLNVTNPSTRDIHDLSSNFDIYISQTKIGEGSFSGLSIPAQSETFKKVTITIYYSGLADSIINILENWRTGEETNINIKGTMEATVLFGLATASTEFTATSQ